MEKESGRSCKSNLRLLLLSVCLVNFVIVLSYYSAGNLGQNATAIPDNDFMKEVENEVAKEEIIQPASTQIAEESICSRPIVSVQCGGRLGNRIWEYATAWAVAKMLNRTVFAPNEILDSLQPVFEKFQKRTSLEDIMKRCKITEKQLVLVNNIGSIETLAAKYPSQNILLRKYIVDHKVVYPYIQEFREEFRFRPEILQSARETIALAGGDGKTLISIHVRRTDFSKYLPSRFNTSLVDSTYFKNAMQWYRMKLDGPLLFLVVSDDVKWCRKNLAKETSDVKIVSKGPAHDLAVMSLCNYSIIDYGTYGYSGAFFSKGTAVTLDVNKPLANYMAEHAGWTVFSKEIQDLKIL
ncbi:galactoside 2-alpha-L-fucosyltransferase SEC1-like [Cloeon dipterum]|uniref:galactoside 2-alpha-L-fucosyltransferase SEC1-like n=1 Tax=Cloeon dipterum TaxID=197152 RepID=UPI00322078DA